jgi:hypothetical protein
MIFLPDGLSMCCRAEPMKDQDYPAEILCSECGCEFVAAPELVDARPITDALNTLDKTLSGGG